MTVVIGIKCDGDNCRRVFRPNTDSVYRSAVRIKAMMAGWHWDPDTDKDYCADCWWDKEDEGE